MVGTALASGPYAWLDKLCGGDAGWPDGLGGSMRGCPSGASSRGDSVLLCSTAAAGSLEGGMGIVCTLEGTSGSAFAISPRASRSAHVPQIAWKENRDALDNLRLCTSIHVTAGRGFERSNIHVKAVLRKDAEDGD